MDKHGNLILTGWGHAEYVAAAAVALKALGGSAEVLGVSRRRLPELLGELAAERGTPQWSHIYMLGVSLSGDPGTLADALAKLKAKKAAATLISALEMPEEFAGSLKGLIDARVFDSPLLESVGQAFGIDVAQTAFSCRRTAARSSSTRSARCRSRFRRFCCASSRAEGSPVSAARRS